MAQSVMPAIVVRLVDFGEADRIATLLTRDAGKVSALGRAARRSRRRFAGLGLFALGEATLRRGRGELWTLESFAVVRGFDGITSDVARVAHAAYVCELARELVPLESHDAAVFALVERTLGEIERTGYGAAELRRFELGLLAAVGLAPSLDRCVGCSTLPTDDAALVLDARRGGVLCAACSERQGRPIPGAVRRALRAAQQGEALGPLGPEEQGAAREVMMALIHEHLGKPLRSLEFIAKLNAAD